METSIQQIAQELINKITEKAFSGGIHDIDALASDVLQDCKTASIQIIERICAELNEQVREDKVGRKEQGLILKEKDRSRELLTELGELALRRDYYYDKHNDRYVSLVDHVVGIRPYERIGDALRARMVSLATEVSYAKSAQIASGCTVSRQSVKNHIQTIRTLEKRPQNDKKKEVSELHIYADEDHVHMQKPNKEKGKKNKNLPIVTVTEGTTMGKGRNETQCPMHFVDENHNVKAIWKSVGGYIGKKYDINHLESIYIHGDGATWIKAALEDFEQKTFVLDGYHLEKSLKALANAFPEHGVRRRLRDAIIENDKEKADAILQRLYALADREKGKEKKRKNKAVTDHGGYLMRNWEAARNRLTLDVPGSCTEAQVSHILSQRFSRDPLGWSEEGLGKLAKLRVYVKNGGEITANDFKMGQDQTYSKYADKVIEEAMTGAIDWSIFDGEPFIFDGASGTQNRIHRMGVIRKTLWN